MATAADVFKMTSVRIRQGSFRHFQGVILKVINPQPPLLIRQTTNPASPLLPHQRCYSWAELPH